MKNLLLSLTLLLPICLIAQEYTPLVVEGATWIQGRTRDEANFVIELYARRIKGDTILDGIAYKKVEYINLKDGQTYPFHIKSIGLAGFVREDINTKKIYTRDMRWSGGFNGQNYLSTDYCNGDTQEDIVNNEQLLYDYGRTVGDSVNTCFIQNYDFWFEDTFFTKDTTEFLYGKDRRVLIADRNSKFIEGIGSNKGFFEAASGVISAGEGDYLLEYCIATDLSSCNLIVNTDYTSFKQSIKIYPNPSINHLSITIEEELGLINIYNLLGHKILCSNEKEIDISSLKSGLFTVEIIGKNNERHIERVVKQ